MKLKNFRDKFQIVSHFSRKRDTPYTKTQFKTPSTIRYSWYINQKHTSLTLEIILTVV